MIRQTLLSSKNVLGPITVANAAGSHRVNVDWEVIFCFEPEALLIPEIKDGEFGVPGLYKWRFTPQQTEFQPFEVSPDVDFLPSTEIRKKALDLLKMGEPFLLRHYLAYKLFAEDPKIIGF
jgi:hypothetical protein